MRFLLGVVVVTLVICQLAAAASLQNEACHRVTEAVELKYRTAGDGPDCRVTRLGPNSLLVSSRFLWRRRDCAISFWTKEPNYLDILPVVLDLEYDEGEYLRMKTILGEKVFFTKRRDLMRRRISPVTQNTFHYNSEEDSNDVGFAFVATSRVSSCSYVCDLAKFATGVVSVSAYDASSYCQSWFKAPQGCRVKLSIESLSVGTADKDGDCSNDFLVVARTGEPAFPNQNSQAFCGDQKNISVVSELNELMYALNGETGGYSGFHGTYEVICP